MGKILTDHTLEGIQFNCDNVFFFRFFLIVEWIEDPVTTKSEAIIGPPEKRHLNDVLLPGR